jgi:hypothetical protein
MPATPLCMAYQLQIQVPLVGWQHRRQKQHDKRQQQCRACVCPHQIDMVEVQIRF